MSDGSMRNAILYCLTAVLAAAGPAHAQGGDKATAEILFNEGRTLMQDGKFDLACEKLAESQRLDPGVGTLLNLAECQERQGRTASAWATWLEAASGARAAGHADREAHARQRADALKSKLVTLTVDVPEENRVEGLAVLRNGTPLGRALWGTAAPVDPGTHTITASAPGHQSWSSVAGVREGTPARVVVPRLTKDVPTAPPAPATPSIGFGADASSSARPAQASDRKGPPVLSYVAGGVGVIGLGVGALFGLQAISKKNDSEDDCDSENVCGDDGLALRDEAFDAAMVSNIGFGVGVAGLAAAAVIWLTAPVAESSSGSGVLAVSATATPGLAAVTVQGAF